MWLEGLLTVFTLSNMAHLLLGSVLGLLVGAAPGLGPVFGLATFISMTFAMKATTALIFMASFYSACVFGGSITAILLNTPGTPGNIATTFDGYKLSQRGEAGRALGIAATASFCGGIIGVLALLFLGPTLAGAAMKIGPAELFMITFAALTLVAIASKGDTVRGLMLAGVGLMLAFVGRSVITGTVRFTFGVLYLEDGVPFVPVVIGLFAMSQAMFLARRTDDYGQAKSVSSVGAGVRDVATNPVSTVRSGLIGTVIGILPGLGINAANFIAYLVEKNASKDPASFGEGNVRGIIAPEAANNASTMSALIPAFALGIPGSTSSALFLSAMMIHGLTPGYSFFQSGSMFPTIIFGMFLAQIAFFVVGLAGARQFAKITRVPNEIMVAIITVLCCVGAFANRNQTFDVLVMFVAGYVGYYLEKRKYPLACLILGLLLGSLAEDNFGRAMRISGQSFAIFFTRPLSLAMLLVMVVGLSFPLLKRLFLRVRDNGKAAHVPPKR